MIQTYSVCFQATIVLTLMKTLQRGVKILGPVCICSRIILFTFTNATNENLIDHNEKDGGMYILPECIASIKTQCLNKDDTKSPNDEKFHHNEEINLLPYACLQKTSIPFFKRFPTAKYSGKMYIRHLFRHGQQLMLNLVVG